MRQSVFAIDLFVQIDLPLQAAFSHNLYFGKNIKSSRLTTWKKGKKKGILKP
jgi:hypothetical protein